MSLPKPEQPQPLVGYRTNEEWHDLLAQIAAMVEDLEKLDDQALRDKVFGALQAIDALHREALHRLVRLFKEGVLEQVATDPAIRTLMEMYGLIPTADSSKKWDFLTAEERATGPITSRAAGSGQPRPAELGDPAAYPHWTPTRLDHAIAEGEARIVATDDGAILIAKVENDFYAVDASCPVHEDSMQGGILNRFSWICPLGAGCVYDIRNGARLGGGRSLMPHSVRTTAHGDLQIGFGIPYEPKLPAF